MSLEYKQLVVSLIRQEIIDNIDKYTGLAPEGKNSIASEILKKPLIDNPNPPKKIKVAPDTEVLMGMIPDNEFYYIPDTFLSKVVDSIESRDFSRMLIQLNAAVKKKWISGSTYTSIMNAMSQEVDDPNHELQIYGESTFETLMKNNNIPISSLPEGWVKEAVQ